jgi:elongation factor Ts
MTAVRLVAGICMNPQVLGLIQTKRWLSSVSGWNAALVRQLRDLTGAPVVECKRALESCGGELDAARDLLSSYGERIMQKKGQRSTNSGFVALALSTDLRRGAMLELRSETDFVHQLPVVQHLAKHGLELLLKDGVADHQYLLSAVRDDLQAAIAKTDENIAIQRSICLRIPETCSTGRVYAYLHNHARVGVLLGLSAPSPLGRQVAMHIAAMQPRYISAEDIEPSVLQRIERAPLIDANVANAAATSQGFPSRESNSKLHAYFAKHCLLDQLLITDTADERYHNQPRTVQQALGQAVAVIAFERFAL